MKLNCVVVDDSSIQRMIITKLVNNHQNLNLVGDFSNAIKTKNHISLLNLKRPEEVARFGYRY
jgi:chemotaxis response regulator CheB